MLEINIKLPFGGDAYQYKSFDFSHLHPTNWFTVLCDKFKQRQKLKRIEKKVDGRNNALLSDIKQNKEVIQYLKCGVL